MIRKYLASITFAAVIAGGVAVFAANPGSEEPGIGSVWDGAYTEEQAERGKVAYEASCMACHAASLGGTPGGPGIAGGRFIFSWSERNVGELLDYVIHNMPVGQGNTLAHETYTDIVAYILQVNDFPAGEAPLSSTPEDSEGIIITRSAE